MASNMSAIEVYIYLPHINKHQQIKSKIHLLINQ